jgi:hypothetical protein
MGMWLKCGMKWEKRPMNRRGRRGAMTVEQTIEFAIDRFCCDCPESSWVVVAVQLFLEMNGLAVDMPASLAISFRRCEVQRRGIVGPEDRRPRTCFV